MASDEDAVRATIQASKGRLPSSTSPPMHTWTQEASLLAQAVDELRGLKSILVKVNSKPGASVGDPKPVPRPRGAWEKIEAEMRLAKHVHLVGRLLPGGRRSS
jgi:hypothetical protein